MNNARAILDDLGTNLFKEKLLTLPAKIETQKAKVRQLREAHTEKEQTRALWEADIMSTINSEINPSTGKPAFSNEKARNAEMLRRMTESGEYQLAAREAKEAEMVVSASQDELERLQDEFRANQFVSQLLSYEVSLFANNLEAGNRQHPVAELKKFQAY